jgi:hypothetical protein
MKTQLSGRKIMLAFALAGLILYVYTFVPHAAQYTQEMQRVTHTPRGEAILMGGVVSLAVVLKLIFVDLWHWREAHRRRKKTGPL